MDSLCWVIKKVLPQKVGYNLKFVKGGGKERGDTHTNSCEFYIFQLQMRNVKPEWKPVPSNDIGF